MLLPPKYKCIHATKTVQCGCCWCSLSLSWFSCFFHLHLVLSSNQIAIAQQQCQHKTIQKTNMTGWIQKLYNQLESRALHTNRSISFNTVMMYLFPRYVLVAFVCFEALVSVPFFSLSLLSLFVISVHGTSSQVCFAFFSSSVRSFFLLFFVSLRIDWWMEKMASSKKEQETQVEWKLMD